MIVKVFGTMLVASMLGYAVVADNPKLAEWGIRATAICGFLFVAALIWSMP